MNSKADEAKQVMNSFIDKMTKYQEIAKIAPDAVQKDIKNYYEIYEDKLMKNYALTGNYFDEPVYRDDFLYCKSLL